MSGPVWIFGYGSLVWRPAFDHVARRPAVLRGFGRRFWQGSTDHRGVPGAPGRVVTLVRGEAEVCWGMAYRLAAEAHEAVLAALDRRERGGYERLRVAVEGRDGASFEALTYLATPRNPNYLGPAPLADIAAQVRGAAGPSGGNPEYVLRLAAALRELGAHDAHVFALEALLAGPGPAGR